VKAIGAFLLVLVFLFVATACREKADPIPHETGPVAVEPVK